jgi:hypothetical protein
MALSLSGCATNGAGISCAALAPIYVSKADVLTDGTARAILVHNESWEANCGR